LLFGIVASSFTAFAISYSTAWSMRVSTSTSYSMVGALNKLPIALSGMIFFKKERAMVNLWTVLSVILGFASGLVYSVSQMAGKSKIMQERAPERVPLKEIVSDGE
jgi:GDP-mannose transporter